MADFTLITSRMATGGGIVTVDDVKAIQEAGISHVVDCRIEFDDSKLFEGTAVDYYWNPTADDGQPKSTDWFARTLSFGLNMLWRPRTRILLHCAQGVNRGPSSLYALMRAVGFEAIEAKTLIHLRRPTTIGGIRYAADADRAIKELGYE